MNLTKLKKDLNSAAKKINAKKEERKAINDDINALRQDLAARGIPKAAFDMALKYMNWDEDKRKGWDAAFALAREAIGLPFNDQGELFVPGEEEEEDDRQMSVAEAAAATLQ
jgi:uncharacterized protein (UPF0335 family)